MKNLLTKAGTVIAMVAVFLIAAPFAQVDAATNSIPSSVALFETSLAASITSSQTTMTLTSAVTKNGTALASSTYAFIIDEGTASEEMVAADCTATACTNMSRGLSVVTGTTTVASLQKAHRRGASVKITDGPQLIILSRLLQGIMALPNAIFYNGIATSSLALNRDNIASVGLVQDTAFAGAGVINASTAAKGVSEIATAAEAAASATTGSSGAIVVLPASVATSTRNSATSGNVIPVTNGSGYIDNAFLSPTQATSLGCVSGGTLTLNGVAYICPSAQGATSTALTNNGSGTLSWQAFTSATTSALSTTALNGGTASTTIFSMTIPANTLKTGNEVRITLHGVGGSVQNSSSLWLDWGFGNASTTINLANSSGGVIGASGDMVYSIKATGSTATQAEFLTWIAPSATTIGAAPTGIYIAGNTKTSTIDTTAPVVVTFIARITNASSAFSTTANYATVEIIRQ